MVYAQYQAQTPSKFLFFKEVHGLDGKKLGEMKQTLKEARTPEQAIVATSDMTGDRRTLKADSFIPAMMAAIYLLLFLYFKTIGGYKTVHIVPVAEQKAQSPQPAPTA